MFQLNGFINVNNFFKIKMVVLERFLEKEEKENYVFWFFRLIRRKGNEGFFFFM